jgi:hypothetical protein
MSVFRNYVLAGLLAGLFIVSGNASATVFVPSYGDSGLQSFSYTFGSDFSGVVTIGVSDQGDQGVASILELFTYGITLSTDGMNDTSAYQNTLGEYGTDGALYSFNFNALAGDTLGFDWEFSTDDYYPFNDFAFIEIGNIHYEVLAEIDNTPVPVPAAVWLFASGLLGLVGMRKRSRA